MAAIVSIEIILPFTLTNTLFGKISHHNKDSVNNTVQCPAEDSKVVTYSIDVHQIQGAVLIILFNNIEMCRLVPLFKWD